LHGSAGRRELIDRVRVASWAKSAQESRDVGVEESRCLFEVGLVEDLVGPLAIGVLVLWVDVTVDSVEELF
jgi:hypothetical protein